MNRSSSSDNSDVIRIVLGLGIETDTLYLKVSPAEGEEIRSLMEKEGVFAGQAQEFAFGPDLLIYVASIGGVGGLAGLAAVMNAYFGRNRNKSIKVSFRDESVEVTGYSEKDASAEVDRLLRAAQQSKAKEDAEGGGIRVQGDDKD